MNHSIDDISNLVRLLNSESTENFQLAIQIAKGMDLPKTFYKGLTKTKYSCWLCLNEELMAPLQEMTTLDFSFMGIKNLPAQLGQLKQLQTLKLDYHRLSQLPEVVTQLTSLETLELFYGMLHSLPASLAQLTQLKHLDLRQNRLMTLPEVLWQMPQLKTIQLTGNLLTVEQIQALKEALPQTKIMY
ncbi:leucine-rich repeat domain-containing protein [uncultured Microscilla sp.]|uniref:leucine-rich repeat domain-containing protein n=1 Tax=uncultured Microscilla sp. TaxID=432653 RepID=UPI00262B691F|nr:leucine-rich repeat domain-containing protein [uncultured Microscilla sp.]